LPEKYAMPPKKIVAGNWKMNTDLQDAISLANTVIEGAEQMKAQAILCPPSLFLDPLVKLTAGSAIALGAQNCSFAEKGAFTGEIAASMIASVGAKYVILGHSERRTIFGEDNLTIQQKVSQALKNNLIVIFCCGETLEEREAGRVEEVITRQITEGLPTVIENPASNIIIAYEPVWAIGTGITASPAQAEEVHRFIRNLLKQQFGQIGADISLLYGGSCNAANAAELFAQENIDGGLIGGASLKAADFLTICKAFA
jgi:triosephosphate isomerase